MKGVGAITKTPLAFLVSMEGSSDVEGSIEQAGRLAQA
jgi:hypothetical protein